MENTIGVVPVSTKSPTPQCFLLTKKVSFEGAVVGQQASEGDSHPQKSTPNDTSNGTSSFRAGDLYGSVTEWFKVLVLKTSGRESVPWVRIPPLPPVQSNYLIVIGAFNRVLADVKQTRGAYGVS